MNLFGLTKAQYNLLNRVVIEPLKKANCKVWIFGSRATNKFQKFSDIDLLYEPSQDLQLNFIFRIKMEIEDSNFPIKVDLVDIKEVAGSYKENILKSRILI